jgi:ribosomal protein L11 methyltransferase
LVTKNWTQVDITCGAETADILAVEFAELFGVSVEFISGGIRIYLDSARFAEQEEQLRQIIRSTSALSQEARIGLALSRIADEDWSQTWKAHFKPLRVGRRFLVSPTWEAVPADPDRLVIRIDPGRAFGTGHHETTRLCLEWLENCLESDLNAVRDSGCLPLSKSGIPGDAEGSADPDPDAPRGECQRLLDVGTGSGILAIGAALLGFRGVVGIDNDPEAIEVAEENIVLNGLSGNIEVLRAIPEEVKGSFDVVISNIQSMPLIRMSETIASKLKNDGRLALSGILVEQADEVCAEYEKRGLRLTGTKTAGEWVLLAFRK